MPKPTFMQSVLRKPTRSYADPYAPSPWADSYDTVDTYEPPPSRYTSRQEAGVHLGFQKGSPQAAGPSQRRRTSSVVSETVDHGAAFGTRFPRPVRKATSVVSLREMSIVHEQLDGQSPGRGGTVKRKKKKSITALSDTSSIASRPTTPVARRKPRPTYIDLDDTSSNTSSQYSAPPPAKTPSLKQRKFVTNGETSSSTTSSPVPDSPVLPVQDPERTPRPRPPTESTQKACHTSGVALPTPPSSDRSSANSSHQRVVKPKAVQLALPARPRPQDIEPVVRVAKIVAPSDEPATDDEAFHTPRASLEMSIIQEEYEAQEILTPNVQRTQTISPPTLHFQPPTPAPIPDPEHSPFHAETSSSASSTLHPSRSLSPRLSEASLAVFDADEDDKHSASGEIGSDEDEESERNGQGRASRGRHSPHNSSSSRPSSRSHSRSPSEAKSGGRTPSSSADGRRSASRSSTQRSNRGFDDFKVHRRGSMPQSEASFGGQSAQEGSVRSGGYGKGGWAAAAASRSGATSPVMMYMPSTANDGWAQFQSPPRQSKFTPLPPASQPATFDRLVLGVPSNGSGHPHSQNGVPMPSGSSPSAYSHSSDEDGEEDDLPRPSRSYAMDRELGSGESQSSRHSSELSAVNNAFEENRWDLAPPIEAPHHFESSRSFSPSPSEPIMGRSGLPSYLRPASLVMPTPLVPPAPPRPASPLPTWSRPTSPDQTPRGFHAPSFLNPDVLTILPEMSQEDSARTYRPSPPSVARSDYVPRRASSALGFVRGTRSEFNDDREDEDHVPELPFRRSRSVIGYRAGDLSRWEGSSAGDGGVLMESNGRVAESISGYTNLVLPAGAYRPSNPAKSATEINARILGLPHATMASITLSTSAHRSDRSATPAHLRHNLPSPVDFTSHLKPPNKVGNAQVLVQVYAAGVDKADVRAVEEKGKGEVGKWVPGRSFVGRCMTVGADEKDIVRGDIVVGLLDIRKSGALSEYIVVDRRRLARAPHPTPLTLEQLALLPLHGIPTLRALRARLVRQSRAIIMDAHAGLPAVICQLLARAGVSITAVIQGGEQHHAAQTACMVHGARGVLTGSPAAVLLGLDEGGWDFILDTQGGQRIYDAAKRILKDGGKLLTLVNPEGSINAGQASATKASGLRTLRAAFSSSKRKAASSKSISFEYLAPAGTGEPEVDSSGADCRDILEEPGLESLRPVVEGGVIVFERGAEAFGGQGQAGRLFEARVVRLIN
ncbi:hypothetical protein BCR39DRAFT_518148 [Naematelia encephala]|uniref:Alcohol dehydrogenase-like N-terminal domain-containing protein n=1 Tax=Naematelia encephala TaxID=71784 RepID=A0A1Y2BGT1_9TREE|nr:hypothetical protein BCR39DRAFT_518148 [Naematelia encephala]